MIYLTLYPKFLQPRSWAVLTYTIQSFWLCQSLGPGYTSWLAAPLSSFPFPPPLLICPGWIWLCPIWTLMDVPTSGYALPFIYNKLFPPPCVGVSCPFLFIFPPIHLELKPGTHHCYKWATPLACLSVTQRHQSMLIYAFLCWWVKELKMAKMPTVSNLNYRVNEMSVKLRKVSCRDQQVEFKFLWNAKNLEPLI